MFWKRGWWGGREVTPITHSAIAITLDYEASVGKTSGLFWPHAMPSLAHAALGTSYSVACEPLPRYALRNISVIDATLLDGFAPQNHTLRAENDEERRERRRIYDLTGNG